MNHPNPQFPAPSDAFGTDGGLVPESSSLLPCLASRPCRAIIRDAMQEDLIDRCKAQLTYNTMERVALLSEAEVRLSRDNPYAAGRFKAITDVYVMSVLRRMTGGDYNGN